MAGERHGHGMLCVNRPLQCCRTYGVTVSRQPAVFYGKQTEFLKYLVFCAMFVKE
jgi:hypothetical protein